MSAPSSSSPVSLRSPTAAAARIRAVPPPGTTPFLDGRAGGVQRVFDQGLAFLHLGLGGGADVDLGDAAGELGEPLLELLAVVLAVGLRRSRGGSSRPGP